VRVAGPGITRLEWTNRQRPTPVTPDPEPDTIGTITVQKRIESPQGVEVEDAPLEGFKFEVRDADADTVVTILSTDSAGTASDTVPVGEYRLVEVFGPRDVEVRAGQDTLVTWTNVYPISTDLFPVGVHMRVEWPIGVEAWRRPPEGFAFEVRDADSQVAVDTLVTNNLGVAITQLRRGMYDIIQIDGLGLGDRTGPVRLRVTGPEVLWLEWTNRHPWPVTLLIILLIGLALLASAWLLRRRPRVTTVSRVRSASVKSEKRL
jgi:hypothetical protein